MSAGIADPSQAAPTPAPLREIDRGDAPDLEGQLEPLPLDALRALVFLEETHNAGLVSDDEYRAKREQILRGVGD